MSYTKISLNGGFEANYDEENNLINGISPDTAVGELIKHLSARQGEIKIYDSDGNLLNDTQKVFSGCFAALSVGNKQLQKVRLEVSDSSISTDQDTSDNSTNTSDSADKTAENSNILPIVITVAVILLTACGAVAYKKRSATNSKATE